MLLPPFHQLSLSTHPSSSRYQGDALTSVPPNEDFSRPVEFVTYRNGMTGREGWIDELEFFIQHEKNIRTQHLFVPSPAAIHIWAKRMCACQMNWLACSAIEPIFVEGSKLPFNNTILALLRYYPPLKHSKLHMVRCELPMRHSQCYIQYEHKNYLTVSLQCTCCPLVLRQCACVSVYVCLFICLSTN